MAKEEDLFSFRINLKHQDDSKLVWQTFIGAHILPLKKNTFISTTTKEEYLFGFRIIKSKHEFKSNQNKFRKSRWFKINLTNDHPSTYQSSKYVVLARIKMVV